MPALAQLRSSKKGSKLRSLTMALFVFLSASTGARIVAADLAVVDRLLVAVARIVSPYKLQLGQFLFLLALNIAGEILDRGLRRRPLLLARPCRSTGTFVFLFLVFVIFGEWQLRTLALRYLQEEQVAHALFFDSIHHRLEQLEGFLLVLHQRIFLAVSP